MNIFNTFGIETPTVLLPGSHVDLQAWSVIACDQFTQDDSYWKRVELLTKDKHSTFSMIFPEIYLNMLSPEQKKVYIERIQENMRNCLDSRVFAPELDAMMYIERKTAYGRLRRGLIVCIDLECYDWRSGSKALIRATEETIIERIPARVDIRRNAVVELPHVMLLVDDPHRALIEGIGEYIHKESLKPLYNFELMMNSGAIAGWQVPEHFASNHIYNTLRAVYEKNTDNDGAVFMFVVGDGNHSLATAKAVWDEYKRKSGGLSLEDNKISIPHEIEHHPLRYALVEIVNLYDLGLTFEPIHRVLFNVDSAALVSFIQSELGGTAVRCKDRMELIKMVESSKTAFGFISESDTFICLNTACTCLAVSAIQPLLDKFTSSKEDIDYIHGYDEAFRLGQGNKTVSVLLPPISKEDIFSTISHYGPLPRKSFSMGEASEKRFYLEARKLI